MTEDQLEKLVALLEADYEHGLSVIEALDDPTAYDAFFDPRITARLAWLATNPRTGAKHLTFTDASFERRLPLIRRIIASTSEHVARVRADVKWFSYEWTKSFDCKLLLRFPELEWASLGGTLLNLEALGGHPSLETLVLDELESNTAAAVLRALGACKSLRRVEVQRVRVSDADLRGAVLSGSHIAIENADLRDAVARDLHIEWCTGTLLCDGADLTKLEWISDQEYPDEALEASFTSANLEQCTIQHVVFRNANFSQGHLANAVLSDLNLSGAKLQETDLSNATIINADLADADLRNATLFATTFRNCSLSGADLRQASAEDAIYDGCDLSGAQFDRLPPTLRGCVGDGDALLLVYQAGARDLRGVLQLKEPFARPGVRLRGLCFGTVHWDQAVFDRADLSECRFIAGSSLEGAS